MPYRTAIGDAKNRVGAILDQRDCVRVAESPHHRHWLRQSKVMHDQHRARVATANLADATVMGSSQSRLPHPRVQPEIAHQLLRAVEPADVADRRHDAGGDRQIDAGDCHQSIDRGIVHGVLRDLAVEQGQVFRQPVKLTDVLIDRSAFIAR